MTPGCPFLMRPDVQSVVPENTASIAEAQEHLAAWSSKPNRHEGPQRRPYLGYL